MSAIPNAQPLRRRLHWYKRILVYLAVFYSIWIILCVFAHLTDRVVLIPTTHRINLPGIRPTTLPFRDGQIELWIGRDTNRDRAWDDVVPKAIVLEFTGNGTRAEEIADDAAVKFRPHPVEVWAMNYPGYGQSSGPARLEKIAPAATLAFDTIRARYPEMPIFVSGNSLGTAAALHVAANRDVAGVVLINPPPLRQLIRGHFGWWNLWLLSTPVSFGIPADLDSISNARRCTAPAIILTSTRDEIVPHRYQMKVADAYAGPKSVQQRDAMHNDVLEQADSKWMREQIDQIWKERIDHTATQKGREPDAD